MFRLKHLQIDTLSEHVIFIHEEAVRAGNLGFRPLDRIRVVEGDPPADSAPREVVGVLNFCRMRWSPRTRSGCPRMQRTTSVSPMARGCMRPSRRHRRAST